MVLFVGYFVSCVKITTNIGASSLNFSMRRIHKMSIKKSSRINNKAKQYIINFRRYYIMTPCHNRAVAPNDLTISLD